MVIPILATFSVLYLIIGLTLFTMTDHEFGAEVVGFILATCITIYTFSDEIPSPAQVTDGTSAEIVTPKLTSEPKAEEPMAIVFNCSNGTTVTVFGIPNYNPCEV